MAERVGQGFPYIGNVAAIDTFMDGPFIRTVHVERSTFLVFTNIENEVIHECDCRPLGVTFIFDFSLEVSARDGRVVAMVNCFSDQYSSGNVRHIIPIKTDYFAQPEERYGD